MRLRRKWLETLRSAKDMTARSVSELSGISESFYSLIESGARRPSVETAKKIAGILGFAWTKFFEEPPNEESARGKEESA